MPAWIGKILYYVGGFLFEKAVQYFLERRRMLEEKREAELQRETARLEYQAIMNDPSKSQKEKEDAFQRFLDRTRPRN